MDFLQSLRFRLGYDFFLEVLDLFSCLFQDKKVTVDNRIQQDISQVICLHLPDASFSFSYPLSHGVEDISLPFLEGDNEILA